MNNVININTIREERYYTNLELHKLKSKQLEQCQMILDLKKEIAMIESMIRERQNKIDTWGL